MTQFLLVTDLDNTLVGDDRSLEQLNALLTESRQLHGTRLVYSTGRSLTSYNQLRSEKHLLEPDALITSVGTEIYHQDSSDPDPAWSKQLSDHWDRDCIVAAVAHFADLVPQPTSEQGSFKVSYFLTEEAAVEVLPQIEALLQERELAAKLIYSGGKDLDILPEGADKGLAMRFLRQNLGFAPEQTVACGDSGNDLALFIVGEERGVIVGNARSELLEWHHAHPSPHRYLATAHCAGGILEGLQHFEFLA